MKVTNSYGLPPVLVKACENQRKPQENSISCTELIDSPLIRRLKLKHWDDLEVDVSEMVWSMTGTALHQMVEKHGGNTSEVVLSTEFEGFIITGTCDHLTPDLISDWKTTSVWSVMLGNDWLDKVEQQLNIYRWLHWRMSGVDVPKVSACVIFRDWRKSEWRRDPENYPPRNIIEFPLECWAFEKVESFIRERLTYHHDGEYVCNMAERWGKPDSWAVRKPGAQRALRVYDNETDALNHKIQSDLAGTIIHEVEHRLGEHTRCNEYCPVRSVCPYKVRMDLEI
jgi:hypothetical protein